MESRKVPPGNESDRGEDERGWGGFATENWPKLSYSPSLACPEIQRITKQVKPYFCLGVLGLVDACVHDLAPPALFITSPRMPVSRRPSADS